MFQIIVVTEVFHKNVYTNISKNFQYCSLWAEPMSLVCETFKITNDFVSEILGENENDHCWGYYISGQI